MKKLARGLLLTCFAISTLALPALKANAALIETDIVIFMDESGSMTGGPTWSLTENIFSKLSLFDSSLVKRNIKANYSVVAYGGRDNDIGRLLQNFTTDLSELFAAVSNDVTGLEYVGNNELAYFAFSQALERFVDDSFLEYTVDAIKNFIVFTDEAPDDDADVKSYAENAINENNVLLNTVLSGGEASSELGELALQTGGNVFNLDTLRTDNQAQVDDFMSGLGDVKAQEIIDQYCGMNPNADVCVDEDNPVNSPATLGLLVAGMFALGMRQRRRRA